MNSSNLPNPQFLGQRTQGLFGPTQFGQPIGPNNFAQQQFGLGQQPYGVGQQQFSQPFGLGQQYGQGLQFGQGFFSQPHFGQGPFGYAISGIGPQSGSLIQELVRDKQRELYHDALIQQLLDSNRFYRQSDNLIRQFMEGAPVERESLVKMLLSDRKKDEDIAELVNRILKTRKLCIQTATAMLSSGSQITQAEIQAKRQKECAFDQEIESCISRIMARDVQSIYGSSFIDPSSGPAGCNSRYRKMQNITGQGCTKQSFDEGQGVGFDRAQNQGQCQGTAQAQGCNARQFEPTSGMQGDMNEMQRAAMSGAMGQHSSMVQWEWLRI